MNNTNPLAALRARLQAKKATKPLSQGAANVIAAIFDHSITPEAFKAAITPKPVGSLAAIAERAKARKALADHWEPSGEVYTVHLRPTENGKAILAKARAHFPRLMARVHPKKAFQLQVCGKTETEWLKSQLL